MDITIDLNSLLALADLSFPALLWKIFYSYYGWLPFCASFIWAAGFLWLRWRRMKFYFSHKFILLAIDIPRDNQQTPKAVENIFSYLAGAHGTINFIEKWWVGKYNLNICLEIVSIEGYTQFLIHAPDLIRNLVESAVYSQYPDAEITEVNDYTESAPSRFPDDEYDIYGAEFIQAKNSAYPIKVYKDFEHLIGETETQYKDTMASLMDLGSSLGKGEQFWFQILLTPIGFEWPEIGDREISKVIGEKAAAEKNIFDYLIDPIINTISYLSDMIFSTVTSPEEKKQEERQDMFRMMNLKPKEKKQVEGIQEKVSKLGFEFKIRFIYLARKEVMNKPKVFGGFVGFMKQFAYMDLNNLKPDTKRTITRASYFFKDYRANFKKIRLMSGYKHRDEEIGKKPGILNIEELATIWHFPIEAVVKAPLLQKTPAKKAEAPATLPVGEKEISGEKEELIFERELASDTITTSIPVPPPSLAAEEEESIEARGLPPNNLPFK